MSRLRVRSAIAAAADQSPEYVTEQQAGRHRPQQPQSSPSRNLRHRDRAEQQQTEHDKRECRAIIEPGFAGQCIAQAIVVLRMTDGDRAREHRIGGREDRAQQQRQRGIHIQEQPRADSHACDRRDHDDARKPECSPPGQMSQRQAQPKTANEQRQNDRDLRQTLDPRGVVAQIDPQYVEAPRPNRAADAEIDGGGRNRQALDQRRRQRHGQEQRAACRHPSSETHVWDRQPTNPSSWLIRARRDCSERGLQRATASTRAHLRHEVLSQVPQVARASRPNDPQMHHNRFPHRMTFWAGRHRAVSSRSIWPETAKLKSSFSPGAKSRSRTRTSCCSRSRSTPSSTSRATTSRWRKERCAAPAAVRTCSCAIPTASKASTSIRSARPKAGPPGSRWSSCASRRAASRRRSCRATRRRSPGSRTSLASSCTRTRCAPKTSSIPTSCASTSTPCLESRGSRSRKSPSVSRAVLA